MNAMVLLAAINLVSGPYELSYSNYSLDLQDVKRYKLIKYGELAVEGEKNRPFLPVDHILVALDPSHDPVTVRIVYLEADTLNDVVPPPTPPSLPLFERKGRLPEPDPDIYKGGKPYPPRWIELEGKGNLFGQKVALCRVNVARYLPSSQSVVLLKRLRFELITRRGKGHGLCCTAPEFVRKAVINPEDVRGFSRSGSLEYLVITSESLRDEFEPLIRWKREKGLKASIRTVEWISANYGGRDLQEKIRNYLKAAVDSGLVWVLLGGDVSVVPHRIAFAMNSGANIFSDEDSIPCDLYYSDLDGTWDYNNNGIFGEVGDSVDMLPDVVVGRAPVENGYEASLFVDKVLHYELESPGGYLNRALFAAEYLDWDTDGGIAKDFVVNELPDGIQVCKLYERLYNLDAASFIDSINSGFNFVNHNGHGSVQILSTGPDAVYPEDFQNLSNYPKLVGLLYSIGCWTAAFDYEDCMAEYFVLASEGGGFYVGNSRYGWYTQFFPGYGSSDIFDRKFFSFLKTSTHRAGVALALVKALMAPVSGAENDFRWNEYTLNYFGDPEMPLYFADVGSLTVELPGHLAAGEVDIPVVLKVGNTPISAGLVGLSGGGELIASGYTDEAGFLLLHADLSGFDSVLVVGTKEGVRPGRVNLSVEGGPFVSIDSFYVEDLNGDGYLFPEEEGTLFVVLRNEGTGDIYSLNAFLYAEDSLVSVVDSQFYVGDIPEGALAGAHFRVQSSNWLRDGVPARLRLVVQHSGGSQTYPLSIVGGEGVLALLEFRGDNPSPGESGELKLYIQNSGHGTSFGSSVVIESSDPYLVISGDSIFLGILPAGKETLAVFQIQTESSCPEGHIAPLFVTMSSGTRTELDTAYFVVGWGEFRDDVEGGNIGWTVDGGLWHITEHRASSGTHSWYCGEEGSFTYPTNANTSLLSPELVLPPDPVFRFRTWYETFAGWDYCILELRRGEERYPLDLMMGSSNGFVDKEYDLSFLEPGDTVRVCFSFVSYEFDLGYEGWYVDDVELISKYLCVEEDKKPAEPVELLVSPNPSRGIFMFSLSGIEKSATELRIYDSAGRLVRKLNSRGEKNLFWDGRDGKGRELKSGVYFYRLEAGGRLFKGNLLLLRG